MTSPTEFYIAKITEGVATIAAAFWPKKVIVRLSDFKSNEYSNLIGGKDFEPHEENPMLGFRGASRYISAEFYDCFELECRALKRVRDDMHFTNVEDYGAVRAHADRGDTGDRFAGEERPGARRLTGCA